MKTTINIMLLSFILFFTGCDVLTNFNDTDNYPEDSITGSGNIITLTKSFSDFSKICAQQSFDITLIESEEYSINIEIDDNIVEYLDIHKDGPKLCLGLTGNNAYNNITLKAVISMPVVEFIGLSGACIVELSGFQTNRSLIFELSGASKVKGELVCTDVNLNLSGASYVELEGASDNLMILGSGASNIYLADFIVRDASIYLSGASVSTINATESLSAYLSGVSVLYYIGNPTIGTLQTSGSSYIRHI